jgi:hypothetical protein
MRRVHDRNLPGSYRRADDLRQRRLIAIIDG